MVTDVSTAWTIRRARPDEHAAARRLAPRVFTVSRAPDRLLVARDGHGELAGVAAVAWTAYGAPPGFPAWIEVAERARRRGCGRALAAAALADCAGEALRVHGWDALAPDEAGSSFAAAIGASVRRRLVHFLAHAAPFLAMIEPVVERLRARGTIPPTARIVPLAEAPLPEVARLVSATFGNRYDTALAAARHDGDGGYDRARSVVLTIDERVEGALLFTWTGGVPAIDVNVVAPAWRRTWANALMLEQATRNGLAAGAERFAFHCDDDVRDTMNLARRVHAAVTRVRLEWTLPVPPAPRPGA